MKIAITGGAGFIASHIADAYLSLGHEVFIIDNLSTGKLGNIPSQARFIEMDVNDPALSVLFMDEKFDIVNHHAAQMDVRVSVQDPSYDARINILGGLNVYESAYKSGVKKIILPQAVEPFMVIKNISLQMNSIQPNQYPLMELPNFPMSNTFTIMHIYMACHLLHFVMRMSMDLDKILMAKQE